jgi:hypothetical protein
MDVEGCPGISASGSTPEATEAGGWNGLGADWIAAGGGNAGCGKGAGGAAMAVLASSSRARVPIARFN